MLDGGCVTAADHGTVVALPEADGPPTYGVLLGSGPRGVVRSHQSDGTLCQLLPLARKLVARSFHVMLRDVQHDPIAELTAATDELRRRGAQRVVLLGASMGAKESLVGATTIRPPVAGVVSLSGEAQLPGGYDVAAYVARLHLPVLFVTATNDPYGSGPAAATFMKVCPSKHEQLVRVPGSEHGIDLFTGAHKNVVGNAIQGFLAANAR